MKIFLKHIMRNIKENGGKTIFILLSLIIVGVILSFTLAFYFSLKSYFGLWIDSYSTGYDYVIFSTTDEKITKERVNEVCDDFEFLGVSPRNQGYILNSSGEYVFAPLLAVDIQQALKMGMFETDEENFGLEENEIIISENFAKKYDLVQKKKIEYYAEDGSKNDVIIKYILKDSSLFQENNFFITNENNFYKITTEEVSYEFALLKYIGDKDISLLTDELNEIEIEYGLNFEKEDEVDPTEEFNIIVQSGIIIFILVAIIVFFCFELFSSNNYKRKNSCNSNI